MMENLIFDAYCRERNRRDTLRMFQRLQQSSSEQGEINQGEINQVLFYVKVLKLIT